MLHNNVIFSVVPLIYPLLTNGPVMKFKLLCHLLCFLTFAAVGKEPAVKQSAAMLPVEAFASIPSIDHITLSPDGTLLSMVQRFNTDKEQLVLVKLFNLADGKSRFLVKADSRDLNILSLSWANNDQLLMRGAYASSRYGTPVIETRLLKIDIHSGKSENVIPRQFLSKLVRVPQFQSNIVDDLPDDPKHILLAVDGLTDKLSTAVVKINLDGELTQLLVTGRENLIDWVADRQHQPRIAIFHQRTTYQIKERDSATNDYRLLWEFEALSADEIWPIGFGKAANQLYVSAYHQGRRAIFLVDLNDPQLKLELVMSDENYDVPASMQYSAAKQKVIGLGGRYIDEEYVKLQRSLDTALPEYSNEIISSSQDESLMLVLSSSDSHPGQYLLWDRKEKNMSSLLERYSQLPPDLMAEKTKVSYQARDGLAIEGWLTLPQASTGKNLPTIVFPHGGPISFDDGGFDYWTQFFANRGYAVLQMNFRGSSGYGFDFMQAGLKNWGLQMQDDVEDGTRWLIKQGVSDPKRICIVGASYGGYAALMGVIKTPELYRCVASFAPVTDLQQLVSDSKSFTNYKVVQKQLGDDDVDLELRSPVNFVTDIQVPVLLVHGTKDRTVRVKHSRQMAALLKKSGKDVEYIELEQGDHYLSTNQHRLQTFQALDQFLQRHLTQSGQ